MRLVLFGDGESPHLVKWARALAAAPGFELGGVQSRLCRGFRALVAPDRRLALHTRPRFQGGNVALLAQLPRLTRWLRRVAADWIHAHYLTSHGTLAWMARRLGRLRARLVGSAWGSDILVAPYRSALVRTHPPFLRGRADDQRFAAMAARMQSLGARRGGGVSFVLDELPPPGDEGRRSVLRQPRA